MYEDLTDQLVNHTIGVSGAGGQSATFSETSMAEKRNLLSEITHALQIRMPEKYGHPLSSVVSLDFRKKSYSPVPVYAEQELANSTVITSPAAESQATTATNPVNGVDFPTTYISTADNGKLFTVFNTTTKESWTYSPDTNTWHGREITTNIVIGQITQMSITIPAGFSIGDYESSVIERVSGTNELSINNVDLTGTQPLIEFMGINQTDGEFVVKTIFKK